MEGHRIPLKPCNIFGTVLSVSHASPPACGVVFVENSPSVGLLQKHVMYRLKVVNMPNYCIISSHILFFLKLYSPRWSSVLCECFCSKNTFN